MNPNDTPTSPEPPIPISPEDDPKLQAIEALEARSIDPDPGPLAPVIPVTQVPVDPPVAPAPQPAPKRPVAATPPPAPAAAPIQHINPVVQPVPIQDVKKVEEKPKVPKTPAAEMAEELANDPPTRPPFQFFLRQKASRKQIMIAAAIVGVIILGVLAYIGFKALL